MKSLSASLSNSLFLSLSLSLSFFLSQCIYVLSLLHLISDLTFCKKVLAIPLLPSKGKVCSSGLMEALLWEHKLQHLNSVI